MPSDAFDSFEELGDNKHGYIIRAVLKILEDGRARSTDEILEAGKAAGDLPKTLSRKSLYIHIVGFIERQQAAGRKPIIVQDPKNRFFQLNRPSDTWPDFQPSSSEPPPSTMDDLINKLHATSRGDDPTAFELAACEAFEILGFVTKHIGGYKAPDACLTAPLGIQAYTSTLECESAQSGVVRRVGGVVEAAQHRDSYHTDHGILLGPSFEKLGSLDIELQTHDIGLWAVDDLAAALRLRANPYELRPLFSAGRAANKLQDIAWERDHGKGKRVRIIAEIIIEQGWKAQVLFASEGSPDQAPLLNEDSAMMLVDTWLQQKGATSGCVRDEVRAAFAHLTSPLVNKAVFVNDKRDAIILTSQRGL